MSEQKRKVQRSKRMSRKGNSNLDILSLVNIFLNYCLKNNLLHIVFNWKELSSQMNSNGCQNKSSLTYC